MNFIITPATENDLRHVFQLFEEAIQYQKRNNYIGWNNYDKNFIREDVQKGFLFKILCNDGILGIFSICYDDKLIWREREKGEALYLHRIVSNRQFQGIKIFDIVLAWAVEHIRHKGLKYVRMDTWAENFKLIDYYQTHQFKVLENYKTPDTINLPLQHRNLNVALLELKV